LKHPVPSNIDPDDISYESPKEQYSMYYEKLGSNIKGLLVCCAKEETIGLHAFSEVSKLYDDFVKLMYPRACGCPV
jgi:hypothetical protein